MPIAMLQAEDVELRSESLGRLQLSVKKNGTVQTYSGVQVKLAFPMSMGATIVSFREESGKEIGLLRETDRLDPSSIDALSQALGIAYFVPKIVKIVSIKEEYGVTRWKVLTDRGPREFDVQSRYDVRAVSKHRYLIRDVDGNRYEIPDVMALDPASRSVLDYQI